MKAIYDDSSTARAVIVCDDCAEIPGMLRDDLAQWVADGARSGWPDAAERLSESGGLPVACESCGGALTPDG